MRLSMLLANDPARIGYGASRLEEPGRKVVGAAYFERGDLIYKYFRILVLASKREKFLAHQG